MEQIGANLKGIYRDVLTGLDGQVIHDSGWVSNTIVEHCRILLAGFIKNEKIGGLQFLAVGQGQPDWDTNGAPAPLTSTDHLENPYDPSIPVAQLQLVYLDSAGQEVPDPTSQLQITATLGANYPAPAAPLTSYPLREFGLFGGAAGAEHMINCVRHPLIQKDASTTLVRVIRLYF